MAVLPDIPGLHVNIEVAGEALPEYEYSTADNGQAYLVNKVSKYVEAPSGAKFTLRTFFKAPFDPPFPVHVEIMFDGDYV